MTRPAGRLLPWGLLLSVLWAPAARGEARTLEKFGRATIAAGWRLTANDYFYGRAAEVGHPVEAASPGGPALCLCFAYSATNNIEVGIDLHGSGELLHLSGAAPISSFTYGALVTLRLQYPGLFTDDLVPYVGLYGGPTLVYAASADFNPSEVLTIAYAGGAGVTLRLGERLGVTLDYRYLLARGIVPEVSSFNGGGHQLTVGLTIYFSPEPLPGESPH